MEEIGRLLLAESSSSIKKLIEIRDRAPKESDQRLASQNLVDFAMKWIEIRSFDDRLTELERQIMTFKSGYYDD